MASVQVIAMFTAMHTVSKAPQSQRLCLSLKHSRLQGSDFYWVLGLLENGPKAPRI
ncbi:hypothetical protein [Vibrio toranzoniae]|uniref:hypothetical protein n=1 Tax=Vibrio toranzoniae TaxID=1194427 RepID=UPI001377B61E|nr:hypothetical protein [Vibrio toranzoniae]